MCNSLPVKRYVPYLLFFFFVATLFSCVKKPTYPSEPVIEYKDMIRYGNSANPDSIEIVLSFTDNEGDIGLEPTDTNTFKTGNLCMVYYYWDAASGKWLPYDRTPPLPPFDTLKFFYRVPVILPPEDKSEPAKGLIFAKQSPFLKAHNRIKYEIFMYDVAKHKSNVVETPAFDF